MRQTRLSGLQPRCPGPQAQSQLQSAAPQLARSKQPPAHTQTVEAQSRRTVKVHAAPPVLEEPLEAVRHQVDDEAGPLLDREQQPGAEPSSSNGDSSLPGATRQARDRRQQDRPEPVLCENPPCKVGDTVVATVIWSGDKGLRAVLELDSTIKGFVPVSQTPYMLRDSVVGGSKGPNGEWTRVTRMPIGLTREFMVLSVPENGIEHYGRGPLLSAKEPDRDVCWQRCRQAMEICHQEQEYVNVRIDSANRGGLVASFQGILVFIPFSRIPRDSPGMMTQQDLEAEWVGKTVPCVIEQVEPQNNKIIGNIKSAKVVKSARQLVVGKVLWGTIARILDFGAFVRPDNMDIDCLLHVSTISRSHVQDPRSVLEEGERIRFLVTGVQEGGRRISLSTAALEVSQGDMLHNKEGVYETAEQMGQTWLEHRMQNPEAERHERGRGPGLRDDFGDGNRGGGGYGGGGRRQDKFNDFDAPSRGGGRQQDDFDDIWN